MPENKEELINDLVQFELDPYGYVMYNWEWGQGELEDQDGPDEWQVKVLVDIGDKLKKGELVNFEDVIQEAVASGHGIGKSALVSWIIKWGLDTLEDTRIVVTANTEKQLTNKTWPELQKWHRLSLSKDLFTCTATAIYSNDKEHEKNWRADAVPWSIHNTEAFAGLHNKGKRIIVIFDEASAIDDKIWEVTEGALTDANTQIIWLAFGNPTRNTGRFRECWRKFRKFWTCWEVDSRTAKVSNKKQIQKWIDTYGIDSDFVKVRVRGMFPTQSAKQFISTELVDGAYGRFLRPEQFNFAPKIITCDPAWSGDDELVIAMRQGLAFKILRTMEKNDNDVLVANIIAQYEDDEQADAVFIDGGYGTGIKSVGHTLGRKHWQLVWFNEKSPDSGCLNMRAYIWDQAKEWLKQGGSIPEDSVLYQDLIGPETIPRLDGKKQLMSKEDMKDELDLPSPNRGDALALSFAYPVQKRNRSSTNKPEFYTNNTKYSPFKR